MTKQKISSIICLQNEPPIIKLSEHSLNSYGKGQGQGHLEAKHWKCTGG